MRSPRVRADLLLVAQHQRDLGHARKGFWLDLRRAAGDYDTGSGVFALELANTLVRLPHRFGGNRTCVDHDRVRDPGRLGFAPDHLGFVGVEPTAERDDLDAHSARASANSAGSKLPLYSCSTGPVIST